MSSQQEQEEFICREAYADSVRLYRYTVAASTFLAIFCLSLRHVCLRDLIGVPSLASQFYFVIGTLQLLISTLDVTIFLPHCPDECAVDNYCTNAYKVAYFIYPALATVLGVLLYREGMRHKETAKAISTGLDEHGEPVMFQRLSTTEMQEQI